MRQNKKLLYFCYVATKDQKRMWKNTENCTTINCTGRLKSDLSANSVHHNCTMCPNTPPQVFDHSNFKNCYSTGFLFSMCDC